MDKTDTKTTAATTVADDIRPDVLNYDDLRRMVPALDGHPKLVERLQIGRAHV